MVDELISKRELLELTGISYGQLYRWKRKNLLPEEWFVKKSSYTGQETFFPKDKILERIRKIQNMKDGLSLDDIAQMFSPDLADLLLEKEEIIKKNIVSKTAVDAYIQYNGEDEAYSFEKILYMSVADKFLQDGFVSFDECGTLLNCLENNFKNFLNKQCEAVFIRKMGISFFIITLVPNEFYIDESAKLIGRVNISKCIEELKLSVK
jgi:DNA-binding transcriptional MerR regulator